MTPTDSRKTLFFDHTGPLVRYEGGLLQISDLNPEAHIQWRMNRWEMFLFGLRAIRASVARAGGQS